MQRFIDGTKSDSYIVVSKGIVKEVHVAKDEPEFEGSFEVGEK